MSLSRDSRQERIAKLTLRTQFRYKQGIERIHYEEDVVIPAIEALKSGKAVPALGLEAGKVFDIVIENENHPPPATARRRAKK